MIIHALHVFTYPQSLLSIYLAERFYSACRRSIDFKNKWKYSNLTDFQYFFRIFNNKKEGISSLRRALHIFAYPQSLLSISFPEDFIRYVVAEFTVLYSLWMFVHKKDEISILCLCLYMHLQKNIFHPNIRSRIMT